MSRRTAAKATAIAQEILREHHPYFSLKDNSRWLDERPEGIDIEYETEVAFAAASGLAHVDGNGFDHAPHQLLPHISVSGQRNGARPTWSGCVVELKVVTLNGYHVDIDGMFPSKIGALAAIIFDARRDTLSYFHVPQHAISLLPRRADRSTTIRCRFDAGTLSCGELEEFRVMDFVDLAEYCSHLAQEEFGIWDGERQARLQRARAGLAA